MDPKWTVKKPQKNGTRNGPCKSGAVHRATVQFRGPARVGKKPGQKRTMRCVQWESIPRTHAQRPVVLSIEPQKEILGGRGSEKHLLVSIKILLVLQGLELQGVSGSVGTHCPGQVTQVAKVARWDWPPKGHRTSSPSSAAAHLRGAANSALQPNALPARGAQRPLGDAVRSSCRAALLRALARVEIEVETRGATRARARGCGKRLRGALGLACHTHLRNSSALGLCQTPTTTNPVSPNCDARPRIETHELTAQRS